MINWRAAGAAANWPASCARVRRRCCCCCVTATAPPRPHQRRRLRPERRHLAASSRQGRGNNNIEAPTAPATSQQDELQPGELRTCLQRSAGLCLRSDSKHSLACWWRISKAIEPNQATIALVVVTKLTAIAAACLARKPPKVGPAQVRSARLCSALAGSDRPGSMTGRRRQPEWRRRRQSH